MENVTSTDGTSIAYDRSGEGPAVILVSGGSVDRSSNAPVGDLLTDGFTVFNYDRRGRGPSGDTPPYAVQTRALRCAFELTEPLAGVGLAIRSAIHTGEIEVREDDVGGIGVHIAARALGEAGDGHVVVTRTVRDLATGTDLSFSPLGSVRLRGVPGEWELFEASID